MNTLIIASILAIFGGVIFVRPEEGPGALAMCVLTSVPTILVLARAPEHRTFLMRLFLIALVVRIILSMVIFVGHMEEFFGGDANTYDIFGQSLVASWHGDTYHTEKFISFTQSGASAWGMLYLVAVVYEVIGRNMLAIQLINASVGAATAIVVYYVAQSLFSNTRVSKVAALLVAFFPSLILWSSQALKDSLIIMALALSILATLRLMEKIKVGYVLVLIGALLALFSLRFYIFYMMAAAVAGSFFLGSKAFSAQGFMQRFVAVAAIGLAFTWFGVLQGASMQFERYANLRTVQTSREDMAAAGSGFMKGVDGNSGRVALSDVCAVSMGLRDIEADDHVTRDGCVVAGLSFAGAWIVVLDQASSAAGVADHHLHHNADTRVFPVSGKRRHCVPAAIAIAGVLFHLRRGGWGHCQRESGRSAATTATSETGTRRVPGRPRPRSPQSRDRLSDIDFKIS